MGLGIAPMEAASVMPLHQTAAPSHSANYADMSSSQSRSQADMEGAKARRYTYTVPLKPRYRVLAK